MSCEKYTCSFAHKYKLPYPAILLAGINPFQTLMIYTQDFGLAMHLQANFAILRPEYIKI